MSLFDFFKKKKKGVKEKVKEKKPGGPEAGAAKEEIRPETPKPKKKILVKIYGILYSPHITEKATNFSEENKYVFKISPGANKIEIKKAVEDNYRVDVTDVKIINIPRKQRRLGKQNGWRKGYKKAIVKIEKGQKIEILPR